MTNSPARPARAKKSPADKTFPLALPAKKSKKRLIHSEVLGRDIFSYKMLLKHLIAEINKLQRLINSQRFYKSDRVLQIVTFFPETRSSSP